VYVQGNRCLMISTFPFLTIDSIAPFNFPAMIPLWTIPLAAVTGNAPKMRWGRIVRLRCRRREHFGH
jgi:hypothetical protein